MRVLLTGATGLIGSRVLDRLVARGDTVQVIALPETVDHLRHRDRVSVVPGDLTDAAAVGAAAVGAEVIFHVGGMLPGNPPHEIMRVNVTGTDRVLRAAATHGAHRLVFTSSTAIYGPAPRASWPIREDSARGADPARGAYAESKLAAEDLIVRASARYGFEHVILRPHFTYGPGSRLVGLLVQRIVSQPLRALALPSPPAVVQWIHADDLADAMVLAGLAHGVRNETMNVAGLEIVTLREAGEIVLGGVEPSRPFSGFARQGRSAGPRRLKFDVGKAQRLLGFTPRIGLRGGLAQCLAAGPARAGGGS